MGETPRVSVMMAVYNAEPYLEEAVRSVLTQTMHDLELIAIDDGSTDGSLGVLRRLAAADERMRVTTRENRGIAATRNEILAMARGEYVALMDADDVSMPDRLRLQAEYLDAHPECLGLTCGVLMMDWRGRPIRTINRAAAHEEMDRINFGGEGFVVNNAYMVRRSALKQIGGFQPGVNLAEDLDMFLKLAEIGRIGALPGVLYHYRQHASSVCAEHRVVLNRMIEKVVREAHERRCVPYDAGNLRPRADRITRTGVHRRWAWWALREGYVSTARHHAARALLRSPHRIGSWKLMYCALRGR